MLKDVPGDLELATITSPSLVIDHELQRRLVFLQSMDGELTAGGLVGQLQNRIRIDGSYGDFIASLVTLRNNLHFTGFALRRMGEISRRQAFEKADAVAVLITGELAEYKKQYPSRYSGVDQRLVTEIVSAPMGGLEDFFLAAASPGTRPSYFRNFSRLYQSVGREPSANQWPDAGSSREAVALAFPSTRMARMLVLDHAWNCFHSPSFWLRFFPADKGADNVQMAARRTSIASFTAWVHWLLNFELFFVSGLVEGTRSLAAQWLGGLPSVWKPGMDVVKDYIRPNDTLNAFDEGVRFVERFQSPGHGLNTKVTVFTSDIMGFEGFDAGRREAEAAKKAADSVTGFDQLRLLADPKINPIIATTPMAATRGLRSITQLTKLEGDFQEMQTQIANVVAQIHKEYGYKEAAQALKAITLPSIFGQAGAAEWYPRADSASPNVYSAGTLTLARMQPTANALLPFRMMNEATLCFYPLSKAVEDFSLDFGFNEDLRARLASHLAVDDVSTLYPAVLGDLNARTVSAAELASSMGILNVLSTCVGRSTYALTSDLQHRGFRQKVVDACSSWLRLTETAGDAGEGEGDVIEMINDTSGEADLARARTATTLNPHGAPYGLGSRAWHDLFTGAPYFEIIKGRLYAQVIRCFALPTREMVTHETIRERSYFAFVGTPVTPPSKGAVREQAQQYVERSLYGTTTSDLPYVTKMGFGVPWSSVKSRKGRDEPATIQFFAFGKPLRHMTMFPIVKTPLFDKLGGEVPKPYAVASDMESAWSGSALIAFDTSSYYSLDAILASRTMETKVTQGGGSSSPVPLQSLTWDHRAETLAVTLFGKGDELLVSTPDGASSEIDDPQTLANRRANMASRVDKALARQRQDATTQQKVVEAAVEAGAAAAIQSQTKVKS